MLIGHRDYKPFPPRAIHSLSPYDKPTPVPANAELGTCHVTTDRVRQRKAAFTLFTRCDRIINGRASLSHTHADTSNMSANFSFIYSGFCLLLCPRSSPVYFPGSNSSPQQQGRRTRISDVTYNGPTRGTEIGDEGYVRARRELSHEIVGNPISRSNADAELVSDTCLALAPFR